MSDEIPVSGKIKLRQRTLIVSYDLYGPAGQKVGGGFSKIESSNGDSTVQQMNAMLRGHSYKITEIVPVT